MKFTTYDVENDYDATSNCASCYTGGWWYNACHVIYLIFINNVL